MISGVSSLISAIKHDQRWITINIKHDQRCVIINIKYDHRWFTINLKHDLRWIINNQGSVARATLSLGIWLQPESAEPELSLWPGSSLNFSLIIQKFKCK